MTLEERVQRAIKQAISGNQTDGAHHKNWSLDQIVRTLAGDQYERVIREARGDYDGRGYEYDYDEGIPP